MRRIFVVGCSRSGTTIVQNTLALNPDLITVPETAFFQRMVAAGESRLFGEQARRPAPWRRIASYCRQRLTITGPDLAKSFQAIPHAHEHIAAPLPARRTTYSHAVTCFVQMMDRYAQQHQKRGWIEKTPSHIHYLPEIRRYLPSAYVVHVIRDGVSVVASLRAAARRYPAAHWPLLYDTLDRCIARWNACQRCTQMCLEQPRHVIVSYDRFAADPEGSTRSLCQALDLRYDPVMLSPDAASERSLPWSAREPWKDKVAHGVDLRHQTKATDVLTADEIEYVRSRLRPIDTLAGHFLEPVLPPPHVTSATPSTSSVP